jgi:alcohol dehydrogenase class IV
MIGAAIRLAASPTEVRFGWGEARSIPDLVAGRGERVLVVTGLTYSGQRDTIDDLRRELERRGITVEIANVIRNNPDVAEVMALAETAAQSGALVGIGGGSVLDATKALAVVARADDPRKVLRDWITGTRIPSGTPRVPTVLVPTTAGTGAELSFGAILSDRATSWKGGIRGEGLAAEHAVVDPALMVSMSSRITATTGFDVLTHAFESYVSKRATAQSRMLSVVAIQAVAEHLPRVLRDPDDREARTAMAFASMMMGLNLRDVGTCLPHRLQYPIGGLCPDVSHPEGLAWIYPHWIERLFEVRGVEVSDLLAILGRPRPVDARAAARGIADWLASIGVSPEPLIRIPATVDDLIGRIEGNLDADPVADPLETAAYVYRQIIA